MPDDLVIQIDCVNEETFLDAIQRGLDVAACAEELAEKHPEDPAAARTMEAIASLRRWFEEG